MTTTTTLDNLASASGTFRFGGDLEVARLGYGAMRLTGTGIWGPPRDHDEALRVLRRAVELGITFFDTADSYGPDVAEELLAEALHPYADELVIATKAGLTRPGPEPRGRPWAGPAYLRQQAELSPAPARRGADRPVPAAPHRPRGPGRRPGRRAEGAPGRGQDPPHRPLRGLRRRADGSPGGRSDRVGAEQVQPRRPRRRRRCSTTAPPRASGSSRGARWPTTSTTVPCSRSAAAHDATAVPGRPGLAAAPTRR